MIPEEQKRTIRRYATMATPRPWRNVCGVRGCNLFADDPHVEVARFNTAETPDGYRTASHNANLAAHAVNVIIPLLDENDRLTAANAALTREVAGLRAVINRALQDIPERYFWHTVEYLRAALSATTDTKETTQRHRPFPSSGLAAIEK